MTAIILPQPGDVIEWTDTETGDLRTETVVGVGTGRFGKFALYYGPHSSDCVEVLPFNVRPPDFRFVDPAVLSLRAWETFVKTLPTGCKGLALKRYREYVSTATDSDNPLADFRDIHRHFH
jgi:hypothetical protein